MGHKENVLEILKKHKDGLTFAELNTEYNTEYGKELGHDLYNYINRLDDKGLVETFIPKMRTGKAVGYRATEKAWEEERKAKALEILETIKDMTNRGAIKYYKDKITQDEIDKLEGF